jgi:hypothetical protein
MARQQITIRPHWLQVFVRDGREYHYFRRPGYPRVRLPDPDSPEFNLAYWAAMDGRRRPMNRPRRLREDYVEARVLAALGREWITTDELLAVIPHGRQVIANAIRSLMSKMARQGHPMAIERVRADAAALQRRGGGRTMKMRLVQRAGGK